MTLDTFLLRMLSLVCGTALAFMPAAYAQWFFVEWAGTGESPDSWKKPFWAVLLAVAGFAVPVIMGWSWAYHIEQGRKRGG